MHRGVHDFIAWVNGHPGFPGLALAPPAGAIELARMEDEIASPLPADLRLLLTHHDGGTLPSGRLLSARDGDGSMRAGLARLAAQMGVPRDDPEVPLPFFEGSDGAVLAFDRSAGPVADTWTISDYGEDGSEPRLVHRTLDGWCRACVAEWSADDLDAPFSLDKYLRAGERHVQIEPDVSVAHATAAHAYRRAGRPEDALASYLRAARCVPSQPWCDWEALKVAAILGDVKAALEAASRLSSRAPDEQWMRRETTPGQVADVLGQLAPLVKHREPLLRVFDQLSEQAGGAERQHIADIRSAVLQGDALPETQRLHDTAVPEMDDPDARWQALRTAYSAGSVREDDLLLDPSYAALGRERGFADLLRIRRDF